MVGIDYGNSVNENILRIGHFNSSDRVIQNAATQNSDVFRLVYQQFGLNNGSRSQIYGGIAGDADLIVGQIVRSVDTRAEIHDTVIAFGVGLLFRRIGKKMQIMKTVAIELDGKILWLFQHESNDIAVLGVGNLMASRADADIIDAAIVLPDHDFNRAGHVELSHGSLLDVIHVDVYLILKKVKPFTVRFPYTYVIIIIVGQLAFS